MSKAPNAIPRALTAESNGEISCSIEETNRVRALLGLKPLKVGSEKSNGHKEIDAAAEARRKEAEDAQEALRLKIEASKKSRAVKSTVMSSSTLAEDADDSDDVNAWIEKQKKATLDKQTRDKEAVLRKARELEEAEAQQSAYSSKDLSGMKVKHGSGDIKAGESMILTLKDSRIVTKGEDGLRVINEDEDELENIVLAADERKRISEARLKKATKYSHLDNEANGHKSGEASLLPQYDEIEEKDGIRLDGGGTFDAVQEEQRKAVEDRIAAASSGKTLEDLTFDKMQQIRSFYTQDEMAAFKKPSKKKLVKRRRGSLAEELEATAGAAATGDAGADHGSRSSKPVAESTARQDILEGRERYERALAAAQLQSVQLLSAGGDDQGIDYDDGNDIAEALARARQAVLKTEKEERDNEFEAQLMQADDEEQQGATDSVIFTETTEFVTSVRGIHQKMADAAASSLARRPVKLEHETAAEFELLSAGGGAAANQRPVKEAKQEDDMRESGGGSDSDEFAEFKKSKAKSSVADTLLGGHQGVASSLSTALNYAKDKGLFNDITKGRTSDRYSEWKEEDVTTGVASVDTIFQKYDQFGREMTQRELWRQLNHQFHGIKPSAKRSERELESYKRELSAKKRANADTPLGSMQMLKAATKVAGQHFVERKPLKPHELAKPQQ